MSLAAISPNIPLTDYQFLDYVPIASTVFNVYCIYLKATQNAPEEANLQDHNYTYLKDKPYWRCIFLLIPGVGNIFIFLFDLLEDLSPDIAENLPPATTNSTTAEENPPRPILQDPAPANDENHSEASIIERLRQDGMQLQNLSDEERDNFIYVRIAVIENGLSLQFASPNRQDEEAIVKLAIEENPRAIQYASPRLQNTPEVITSLSWGGQNREIGERIIHVDGMRLQDASENLRDDWNFVSKAVVNNFDAFRHASNRLKQDPTALKTMIGLAEQDEAKVKALLTINGLALEFALPEHQNNESIVKIAILQNFRAFYFASDNLRKKFAIINYTREQVQKKCISLAKINQFEGEYDVNLKATREWRDKKNDNRPATQLSTEPDEESSLDLPPALITYERGFEFVIKMINSQIVNENHFGICEFSPDVYHNATFYLALVRLRHLFSCGSHSFLPQTTWWGEKYVSMFGVICQILKDKGFIQDAKQVDSLHTISV